MIEKHEISVMMRAVGRVVKDYVMRETYPIKYALGDIEKKIAAIPVPKDGKDADPALVRAEVDKAFAALASEFTKGLDDGAA